MGMSGLSHIGCPPIGNRRFVMETKIEVGETYGYTTVLAKAGKDADDKFLCKCRECGSTFRAKAKDIQGKFRDGCVFCLGSDGSTEDNVKNIFKRLYYGDKVGGGATVIDVTVFSDSPDKPKYAIPRTWEVYMLCEYGDGHREIHTEEDLYPTKKNLLEGLNELMEKMPPGYRENAADES